MLFLLFDYQGTNLCFQSALLLGAYNGKPGYLGYSSVHLSYLEDGWISLVGDNVEESNGWKLLSTFTLETGSYTLTGMRGQDENTVALQLHIEDETGFCTMKM